MVAMEFFFLGVATERFFFILAPRPKGIAVMIATARKHPSALTAMAHTQLFLATAQHEKKEIISVKYKRSITFYEELKIVAEQLSAPGNSYASITKGAGVHVKCTDAQTQIDETYIVQLTSAASGGDPHPQHGQKAGGCPPPVHKTNAGDKPVLHQHLSHHSLKASKTVQLQVLQVGLNLLTKIMRQNRRLILEEYQKDQMIPLNHTTYLIS